jgi:hypothetical protein
VVAKSLPPGSRTHDCLVVVVIVAAVVVAVAAAAAVVVGGVVVAVAVVVVDVVVVDVDVVVVVVVVVHHLTWLTWLTWLMQVKVLPRNPLFPAGSSVRGQMYHFSEVTDAGTSQPASGGATSAAGGCETKVKSLWAASTAAPRAGSTSMEALAEGTDRCCSGASCDAMSSDCSNLQPLTRTYQLKQVLPGAVPALEGYSVANVLASYVHLHWGGCPDLAAAFVAKCRQYKPISSGNKSCNNLLAAASDGSPPVASCPASSTTRTAVDAVQEATRRSCTSCCSNHLGSSSSSSSIVSLLPSCTEILFALGLGHRLVGVSSFCDSPEEALEKPVIVRSLIDVSNMTSDEVEAAMQVDEELQRQSCFLEVIVCNTYLPLQSRVE